MSQWLVDYAIRYPKKSLLWIFLLMLIPLTGYQGLWIATDYEQSFDTADPLLIADQTRQETFSKTDNVLVIISRRDGGSVFSTDALAALREITIAGWRAPRSMRVDSLSNFQDTQVDGDELTVRDFVSAADIADSARHQSLRERALADTELAGRLVAPDASAFLINILFDYDASQANGSREIMSHLTSLTEEFHDKYPGLNFQLTGAVANADAFLSATLQDSFTLLPVAYCVMVGLLLFFLRSVVATVVTLTIVTISILFAFGTWCWWFKSLNSIVLAAPTVIMVIAVSDSIHVLISFLQKYRAGSSKEEALRRSFTINMRSLFLTSATTLVGFLCLNTHESPPYRQLGNVAALGVVYAYFLTLVLLPALVMLLPIKKGVDMSWQLRLIAGLADFITRRHKVVLILGVLAVPVIVVGLMRNEVNERFNEYLDESFEFRRANDFLNERVTGIHRLFYSLDAGEENGINDPAYLARLDAFSEWLKSQPEVAHVASYADIIKRLNKTMNGGDAAYFRVPESRELAAQYALLYEMSLPFGQDLTNIVSLDRRQTLLLVTAWETRSGALLALNSRAEAWLKEHTPPSMHVSGTGIDLMFSSMAMRNIPSVVYGTMASLLLISVMLVFAFRSWNLGVASSFSNMLPAICAFGVWGYIDGRVDLAASMVSILALGLVVDDTIHFLNKYNMLRREGLNDQEAVIKTLQLGGMAMIATTAVLSLGFLVLGLSPFSANATLGVMMAITLWIALAFDLVMMPAWIIWRHNTRSGQQTLAFDGRQIPEPPPGLMGHLGYLTQGENQCAFDALSRIRQVHGDICQIRILGKPWICVTDADAIETILVRERDKFPKKGDAVDEMAALFGDQGILVTEGEQWLRQRKMCMPAFRMEQLVGMVHGMNKVGHSAVSHLRGKTEIDALSFMSRAAFANVCLAAFDYDVDALSPGVHDPILETQEMASRQLVKRLQRTKYWKHLPIPANFKMAHMLATQEKRLRTIIAQQEQEAGEAKILLNEFLRARDDHGKGMTDTELLHMCMQFMAAGHETTGAALQWTLYYLASHPDVQDRVFAEAQEVLGNKQDIDYEDVKKLRFFEQVFNEAMRVRAPIPIMVRTVGEDTVVNGFHFPRDSVVMLMVADVQRDPRHWGENAAFFDPSNFSDSNPQTRPRAAFMPFGIGPRMCIGHRFTMLEAATLVVQLIRHYEFGYISGQNVRPFMRTTWSTKNGIRLTVTPRTQRSESMSA